MKSKNVENGTPLWDPEVRLFTHADLTRLSFPISAHLTIEEDTIAESNGLPIIQNKNSPLPILLDVTRQFNSHAKDDLILSTSHATSASIAGTFQYCNTYNQSSNLLSYKSRSLSRIAQSADTYFLLSNAFARKPARPKALTNPFAPASIRIPMAPGRRRWAHTFPMGTPSRPGRVR